MNFGSLSPERLLVSTQATPPGKYFRAVSPRGREELRHAAPALVPSVVFSRRVKRVLLVSCLIACFSAGRAEAQPEPSHAVEVQMHNVMYHFTDGIAAHIRSLHGQLAPKGDFPIFDDKDSFTLQIAAAEIAITTDSLANALNSYVFARRDAPLKAISIEVENTGRLKIKGKLHSKGDIPFETAGRLSTTADGKIRLHADAIKALHLPAKGIMDLLGLQIADLIKTGKVPGVQVEKDDLILDPGALLPSPHIAGQVTGVRLEGNNIVQVFGRASEAMPMHVYAANYMAYRPSPSLWKADHERYGYDLD